MPVIHISEADAARDFASLLTQVRAGAEVVIEDGLSSIAVLHMPVPPRRTIEECISLLREDSRAVIDQQFSSDTEEAVRMHRESLNASAWAD